MRFLHTADWHLGRLFHARSLIEDQACLLDQLVELVRELRPDALLVAGDVYDRAVPPAEAVALLDDTLSRIVLGLGVPVVMIAGNHDSADRLGFGARLLSGGGLTIAGRPGQATEAVRFGDAHGALDVYPVPYAEPAVVRDLCAAAVADHDAALGWLLDAVRARRAPGVRAVVLAHAFVAGGSESESERPLSVGGSGAVAAARFAGFDYVALGHLHRPQRIGEAPVEYAGSLMKYSLSEADHVKSVSLVEINAPGDVRIERIALKPPRDLRCLRGTLAELIEGGRRDPAREDYVFACLTDRGALLDPVARLRAVYPNVLGCERTVLARPGDGERPSGTRRALDLLALFGDFHRETTGEALDPESSAAIAAALDALAAEGRESA
ncbi:MAG: exonuclease SbcCD subunit D [Rhodocyclaceae bacterium]|jgi:exonuclease SbcD|nr:exonuclease SbcCD subunit D [Rhodocyclaceae bacterium]